MPARPQSCDVAVVGAGIIGLTIAEELLSRGLSVTVVDRQSAGREASWAGAGILPPGSRYSDHPALEELAAHSFRLNAELSQRLRELTSLDDGFWRCGAVYFASTPEQQRKFGDLFARWRSRDIRVDAVGEADLAELAPYASDRLKQLAAAGQAFHVPAEAQARNPRRLRAIVALCESWGGRLIEHDEVTSVDEAPQQVTLRLASGAVINAGRAVIASGAWASRFLPAAGSAAHVRPVRGQMLLLEGDHALANNLHVDSLYLAPRRDGRVLAGATVEEAAFDKSNTAEGCATLLDFVRGSGLGGLRLVRCWAGLRPATPDELPLIGPASDRVYIAAGHYRAGLQFACATAMLIREMMLGQPPSMDATPFRIDR
ncbi:Glycine oxidase [Posidoniimonas corsicana]|uniref:Glycine oxidase n=1 Tax=Posidoniimonas corsicana TaxID=1938618 RepID=A0A5C5VB84_9BACT|nr:FAD-dependent oxidoreductase [Posidoniimonas corsicana]TWT35798.1 Glycine oxidase [Posidoniimonas corsicana]